MKAVILAGGFGTRISEESSVRPKPMIEIGNRPILWHIMKIYSTHGINDFVICCGYKGYMIKDYFANYHLHTADVTYDLQNQRTTIHRCDAEPWRVTCVETGEKTMTGGRLKRVADYLGDGTFCLTYGDGVSNIDITASIAYHKNHGKLATLSAVQSPGRFGAFTLSAESSKVESFHEKPKGDGAWINGGFFILEPGVLEYIEGDSTVFEREPMEILARDGQLQAWKHDDFWQSMDTLRDRMVLEDFWAGDSPPWKLW
ncbi:MAG: glucose-1-phosphate cytidylyltransferase [Luteolibacter sp.]|jgi:glucose-1-phosphate cytidylyltransferase|nr:glucose-1-phosphate cytidylyltransferase [Luteolibacter sp.]